MHTDKLYINGAWVTPAGNDVQQLVDPGTGTPGRRVALGNAEDVDRAVAAARRAFDGWAALPQQERIAALERLQTVYDRRIEDMARAISEEMGAPIDFARSAQAEAGRSHLRNFLAAARDFDFATPMNADGSGDLILREAIGVCGLITPWNWPVNQIALKALPALAVGCTVVLKPSEIAPLSALVFAEMVDEAGFPPGVFNLVNGTGPDVGAAMSTHPDIDLMSFTGSNRAGVEVMRAAAPTVKRVALELGGKSPNLIFADSDLEAAVTRGARAVFSNSGQSCNAPTRMLVEASVYDRAVSIAAGIAAETRVGRPDAPGGHIGPVISGPQFDRIQGMIATGLAQGARLAAGGPGRPEGLADGFYVRPTVFADVSNDMRIAREEIFGPVLCMIPFSSEDEAVAIANDTPYGLAAQVQTADPDRARRIARRLRAGMVQLNGAGRAPGSPFGGYKQSGLGREGGRWGLDEFLEIKAVSGW